MISPINITKSLASKAVSISEYTSKVATDTQTFVLPQFLYHFTPTSNLKKILQSGKLKVSNYEKHYRHGLTGVVYMVDKENFLNMWLNSKHNLGIDLIKYIISGANGKLSSIKIPVSSLDKTKFGFRPFETYSRFPYRFKNMTTYGLPVSELSKYKEPIEYIYSQEIPTSIFSSVKNSQISELLPNRLLDIFG